MPRFNPNPAKAVFGFLQYPKGTYHVQISDPKAFLQPKKDKPGESSHGVRFSGKIIASNDQPDFVGKPHQITLYLHTEGAENYSKQIEAAALGCKSDTEFNEKFGSLDWGYDTDDGSVGEGYRKMDGQILVVTYGDMKLDKSNDQVSGNATYSTLG